MKKTTHYLIALVVILITSFGAKAQGGASPYLNSTHTYTVTMQNGANTAAWVIADNTGVALATQPTISTTKVTTTATLVITWADTWAAAGTDYKIWFTETGTCTSKRELPVSVKANTFYLSMNADASECHDLSGQILAVSASGPTTLQFPVKLNKDVAWTIDSWKFDFTVTVSSGYTLQTVKINGGADLGSTGTYTNQTILGTISTATIDVVISGPVESGATVTIAVSNGKAIKGTIITPDNSTGDRNQILTVNALPATSVINAD
jgi:hypothetical protein